MSDDVKALQGEVGRLQQAFETHRGDMVRYMDTQTQLLQQVVTVQAKQQENEKSTNKLFDIYAKLSDRVRDLEIVGASGQVKMASNERVAWFSVTLLVAAVGLVKYLG